MILHPMDPRSNRPGQAGQALAELLLALPLLLLLASAAAQFSVLFLTQIRFERSCHQAARRFAAGLLRGSDLAEGIREGMGPYRGFLKAGSLRLRPDRRSPGAFIPGPAAAFLGRTGKAFYDLDGGSWTVHAVAAPPFLFGRLFPEGIPLHTRLHVLRHPGEGHHGS